MVLHFISLVLLVRSSLNFDLSESSFKSIRESHSEISSDETVDKILKMHHKTFKYPKESNNLKYLGYVTPWNPKGEQKAIEHARTFNFISPTWYNAVADDHTVIKFSEFTVNHTWISELRSKNPEIKIVPRLAIDGEMIEKSFNFSSAILTEVKMHALTEYLVKSCLDLKFDGLVIDSLYLIAGEYGNEEGILWIRSFYEAFLDHGLILVIVIPPINLNDGGKFVSSVYPSTIFKIFDFSSFVSLMTYDFSIHHRKFFYNSPINWIVQNLMYISQDLSKFQLSKLLLGLNFYGRVISDRFEPITGDSLVEKLKICDRKKSRIVWNKDEFEHFFYLDIDSKTEIIAYPTLKFIEERLNVARAAGVGVAIWELGQGLDYFFDIL